jgi:DNA-binding PadR family transcriptional regulator
VGGEQAAGQDDAPRRADWSGGSALRGPILGLLLQQQRPIAAYRLSGLLIQRLPEWRIRHSSVANLLKQLAGEGYAEVSLAGTTATYRATDKARLALESWMRRPLSRQTLRDELRARIASASPHHAPLLYEALDAYEQECFDLLDEGGGTWEPSAPMGSWRSLTISLVRSAADETLRGHINWTKLAKRALKDWVAAHPAPALAHGTEDPGAAAAALAGSEALRSSGDDAASA